MDIYILAAFIVVLLTVLFYFRRNPEKTGISPEDVQRLKNENEDLRIGKAKAEERAENLKAELDGLKAELHSERSKLSDALQSLESLRSYFKAQQEKLEEQRLEIKNNQEKFSKDFELIASRVLEEKTKKFTDQNRTNLDILLNPLK
ncbi:MAG: DNA recombination protein RmuC, partial [Daejeonella sp.]